MRFLKIADYNSYLAYGATVLSAMASLPVVVFYGSPVIGKLWFHPEGVKTL